jgi:hypothetical protein
MTTHSVHEWINSAGVVLALVASSASAYFAWQANLFKYESLSVTAKSDESCKVRFAKFDASANPPRYVIGLCWNIVVSNNSEMRTSLINFQITRDDRSIYFIREVGPSLTKLDGSSFPLSIDSGETVQLRLFVAYPLRDNIAEKITFIANKEGGSLQNRSLGDVERELWRDGVDLFENQVDAIIPDNTTYFVEWKKIERNPIYNLKLLTGRGSQFDSQVSWLNR